MIFRNAVSLRLAALLLVAAVVSGCSSAPTRVAPLAMSNINDALLKAASERKLAPVDAMDKSLMPPLAPQTSSEAQVEARFDLSVVNAPASQVFMALVSGTRYSMLLPPELTGNLTINLKDVTVIEALDTIRELYGYEFRIQGKRVFIEPNTMKTRVFQINYLSSQRAGSSSLSVSNRSVGGTANSTSSVSMSTSSDFWKDLSTALVAIIGNAEGRSVVVNQSSGVVIVRALPTEQRAVEKYLRATQLIAERQVMLEAKIIDVTLDRTAQSGINWAAFKDWAGKHVAVASPQTGVSVLTGSASNVISRLGGSGSAAFGLAFQAANFSTLLTFLETQGMTTVLSSPRIATLNNQKAVLKVGTDEMYVTNMTLATAATTTTAGTAPSVTLQPYFSGISLDVTPQIDEEGTIILHVHPAVSTVMEKSKIIDLGTQGTYKLPLAASSINETDSIVRVQDGQMVAIGGLMREDTNTDLSQIPGSNGLASSLLGRRSGSSSKRELVILIKPTMIQNDNDWAKDLEGSRERVRAYTSAAAN